jgi:hypothetical protein
LNRNKALLLLGAAVNTDKSTLIERLEDEVFIHASFFLKRAFVPKLAKIKMQKLQELSQAADLLELNEDNNSTAIEIYDNWANLKPATLSELLRNYHQTESSIKTSLANAIKADYAVKLYAEWLKAFAAFAENFSRLYKRSAYYIIPDATTKQSQTVDVMLVISELESNDNHKPELHKLYSWLCKVTD